MLYPHDILTMVQMPNLMYTQRLATVTFGYFRVQIIQYEICHSHPPPYFFNTVVYDEYGNFPSLSRDFIDAPINWNLRFIFIHPIYTYNICILYVYLYKSYNVHVIFIHTYRL